MTTRKTIRATSIDQSGKRPGGFWPYYHSACSSPLLKPWTSQLGQPYRATPIESFRSVVDVFKPKR
ncbi:hypothetical protein [Brevibacillus sp. DP1.3A]|uniref:hypothetical protein n=1 Tax=Brevibacillus sp. DP1.3A TaxID=2738867 RepID=UPI00156BA322|nr:hypothetical protein [Brevibacillus sp. DP1.3A]UED76118.1 hypothetical protein HP399_006395 [Brevibacillus sp. DP1.3A]